MRSYSYLLVRLLFFGVRVGLVLYISHYKCVNFFLSIRKINTELVF